MTASQKMKTTIDGSTLTIERLFTIPKEIVFEAFSQPQIVEKWWGPEGWQTDISKFEFRRDGEWHYRMYCSNQQKPENIGKEVYAKAVFQSIVAPDKIIYKDVALKGANHKEGDKPEMLTTIEFGENESQTKVLIHVTLKTPEELQQVIAMGHRDGMEMQLNKLESYLLKD